MKTNAQKVVKIIVNVLLWIFLAFALFMTIIAFTQQASGGYPKLGKKCYFTVLTDSMENSTFEDGGFNEGDLITDTVLSDEEKLTLKENDVITFLVDLTPYNGLDDKVFNSHRIVEVKTDSNGKAIYYKTKGDNEAEIDSYNVYPDMIEAKWTGKRVKGLGKFISYLQSRNGFLICIVLPLLIFFIYELFVTILTIMKIRNKGQNNLSTEEEEAIKQRAIEEYLAKQATEKSDEND